MPAKSKATLEELRDLNARGQDLPAVSKGKIDQVANRQLAKDIAAALKKNKNAQGQPFVMAWRIYKNAADTRSTPDDGCECGCECATGG